MLGSFGSLHAHCNNCGHKEEVTWEDLKHAKEYVVFQEAVTTCIGPSDEKCHRIVFWPNTPYRIEREGLNEYGKKAIWVTCGAQNPEVFEVPVEEFKFTVMDRIEVSAFLLSALPDSTWDFMAKKGKACSTTTASTSSASSLSVWARIVSRIKGILGIKRCG